MEVSLYGHYEGVLSHGKRLALMKREEFEQARRVQLVALGAVAIGMRTMISGYTQVRDLCLAAEAILSGEMVQGTKLIGETVIGMLIVAIQTAMLCFYLLFSCVKPGMLFEKLLRKESKESPTQALPAPPAPRRGGGRMRQSTMSRRSNIRNRARQKRDESRVAAVDSSASNRDVLLQSIVGLLRSMDRGERLQFRSALYQIMNESNETGTAASELERRRELRDAAGALDTTASTMTSGGGNTPIPSSTSSSPIPHELEAMSGTALVKLLGEVSPSSSMLSLSAASERRSPSAEEQGARTGLLRLGVMQPPDAVDSLTESGWRGILQNPEDLLFDMVFRHISNGMESDPDLITFRKGLKEARETVESELQETGFVDVDTAFSEEKALAIMEGYLKKFSSYWIGIESDRSGQTLQEKLQSMVRHLRQLSPFYEDKCNDANKLKSFLEKLYNKFCHGEKIAGEKPKTDYIRLETAMNSNRLEEQYKGLGEYYSRWWGDFQTIGTEINPAMRSFAEMVTPNVARGSELASKIAVELQQLLKETVAGLPAFPVIEREMPAKEAKERINALRLDFIGRQVFIKQKLMDWFTHIMHDIFSREHGGKFQLVGSEKKMVSWFVSHNYIDLMNKFPHNFVWHDVLSEFCEIDTI